MDFDKFKENVEENKKIKAEIIKKISEEKNSTSSTQSISENDDCKNKIAETIRMIAFAELMLSLIGGIILSTVNFGGRTIFSFQTFAICLISGTITCAVLVGFAEIIQILHDIRKNTTIK